MKIGHTPGPWMSRAWGRTLSIDNENTSGIAFINPRGNHDLGIPSPRDSANGRLIAATPELLSALKALVNITTHPKATKAQIGMIVIEAYAVIARAEE